MKLSEWKNLVRSIDNATRDLPDKWKITLCMESGSAWVELEHPGGDVEHLDPEDEPLEDQINRAVERAMKLDMESRMNYEP